MHPDLNPDHLQVVGKSDPIRGELIATAVTFMGAFSALTIRADELGMHASHFTILYPPDFEVITTAGPMTAREAGLPLTTVVGVPYVTA